MTEDHFKLEVCFSPELIEFKHWEPGGIIVVTDVLRASPTICAALKAGVEKVVPVANLHYARKLKEEGWLAAGEREGLKLDFADYGNSPVEILNADLKGKTLVLTTSNGTKTIEKVISLGEVIIGCFNNLSVVAEHIIRQNRPVLIACSGWKGNYSLEDVLYAGALAEILLKSSSFLVNSDETTTALQLWFNAKSNIKEAVFSSTHARRLLNMGAEKDIHFACEFDNLDVIPCLKGKFLINIE